ncbi:MAG: 50S ribosomal protein L1 [Nanobdellota archaeon]
MKRQEVLKALKEAKEKTPKRNFKQSIDLIITLKNLNLKKPDQQVDFFVDLPHPKDFPVKVCGLVGTELYEQAKETFDHAIHNDEFATFKQKKDVKKLANSYDFFVAQANLMSKIAQTFGRALGPRGKMPNPKAGCVVPPNANLQAVKERLQKVIHISVKKHLMYQTIVGKEDSDDEKIADTVMAIYDQLMHHLPLEKNNIKGSMLKLTMGKPVPIGE